MIIEIAPATFPVNPALTWTADISAISPLPQVGWAAVDASGTFTAPALPPVLQQPPIRDQLSALDMDIPRGLEDMWIASGFDTTKLPVATQTKLATKVSLRAQLAALIAANTL